jgi:glutaredoxin-like protein
MGLMKKKERAKLTERFAEITHPVTLVMFTQQFECNYCSVAREMVEELADLSDKISVSVHDFVADRDLAEECGVDKIPAIVVRGDRDHGVRFFGVPAGYEFTALVEDILAVGRGGDDLKDLDAQVVELLSSVDRPVRLQVMVTPTCPKCPRAVLTAHRLAMASDHITADMVEVTEFPYLINKFDVVGVPHTVIDLIDDFHHVVGAQPPQALAEAIVEALAQRDSAG